jgi:hypothetical protein
MRHIFQFLLVIIGILLVALSLSFTSVISAKDSPKSNQDSERNIIVYESDGFYENYSLYLTDELNSAYAEISNLKNEIESLEESNQKMQSKLLFESIALNVSQSYTYDRYLFNCQHFSNELVQRLRQAGYNARISTGYVKDIYCTYDDFIYNGCLHNWVTVSIPIEATSGKIISNHDFLNYYAEVN